MANVLEKFPKLKVAFSFTDEWPNNRKIYPLVENYKGFHVCIANMLWMGGIEHFVGKFGSNQLLFDTGFPEKFIGSAKVMLKNSDIVKKTK